MAMLFLHAFPTFADFMSSGTHIQVSNSYANIIRLALPVSIAILIPQVNIMTNTVFLGYYQPAHSLFTTQDLLAASGIAGIYYLTLVMVGYGLSSGLLMLMSRKAGGSVFCFQTVQP